MTAHRSGLQNSSMVWQKGFTQIQPCNAEEQDWGLKAAERLKFRLLLEEHSTYFYIVDTTEMALNVFLAPLL